LRRPDICFLKSSLPDFCILFLFCLVFWVFFVFFFFGCYFFGWFFFFFFYLFFFILLRFPALSSSTPPTNRDLPCACDKISFFRTFPSSSSLLFFYGSGKFLNLLRHCSSHFFPSLLSCHSSSPPPWRPLYQVVFPPVLPVSFLTRNSRFRI